MAQGIKEFVAHKMNQGNSVRTIVSEVKNNSECNWYDVVKTALWWLWFKCEPTILSVLDILKMIFAVLFWVVILLIIGTVVSLIVTVVAVLTAPFWMPFRLWFAPEKVATLLLDTAYEDINKPEEAPFAIWENIWLTGGKFMNFFWAWAYNLLPMSKRQWFIKESDKKLKDYEPATQLAYYDEQAFSDKVDTLKAMSEEAMRQVWNRGHATDRGKILQACNMGLDDFQLLFNGGYAEFELLKSYCTDKKAVSPKLQMFFVEQLENGRLEGELSQLDTILEKVEGLNKAQARAFELLKICSANSLEPETLLALIKLLESAVGEQAKELLHSYWSRNTLSDEVVKKLVEAATGDVVNEAKTRADELLMQAVKRDGISTANAESYFKHCDKKQEEALTNLIELRVDLDKVGKSADNNENRAEWLAYCGIRKNFSPEAQKKMSEWQYDYFRETGHKLDEEVIYYLLVKRLTEYETNYFEKVLKEAEKRDCLDETAQKLMVMTTWKREIILQHIAKAEKEKGYSTL
jgi:hypothetical protein